jgi:hypothetical protein
LGSIAESLKNFTTAFLLSSVQPSNVAGAKTYRFFLAVHAVVQAAVIALLAQLEELPQGLAIGSLFDIGSFFSRHLPPSLAERATLPWTAEFDLTTSSTGNELEAWMDSNLDMANWNRMLSAVREEPQNLFSLKFIGPSKRWNFENRTKSAESRASEINGPFGE